jgi:2-polyprenyl-3-methyl-5-hydroxy-6-metoxy-1,4-benzoquinol methylase
MKEKVPIRIDDINLYMPYYMKDRLPLFYGHIQHYRYLTKFTKDKCVLDIGCSEGYGSYYLSHYSKQVIGIDFDMKRIQNANQLYRKENLNFHHVNIYELNEKFPDLQYNMDVVLAMEFIEHLQKPEEFIHITKKMLKQDGIFFLSTPNRLARDVNNTPWNPEHIKEYSCDELNIFLSEFYKEVKIIGLDGSSIVKEYEKIRKGGNTSAKLKKLWRFTPELIKNPIRKQITSKLPSNITIDDFFFVEKVNKDVISLVAICKK